MINLTRRQSFGIPAGVAAASSTTVATAVVMQTAQEKFDYHLAELKRAAEELDPSIGYWKADKATDGSQNLAVVITAPRTTGRYEGDGMYEAGTADWNGRRINYHVRLRSDFIQGERSFDVWTSMDRLMLSESRLSTFVGRRIADLPEGAR